MRQNAQAVGGRIQNHGIVDAERLVLSHLSDGTECEWIEVRAALAMRFHGDLRAKHHNLALKNLADVKALLPDDNAVLGVVLYELGLAMTADGISIETAKGQLSGTLSDLVGGTVFGR